MGDGHFDFAWYDVYLGIVCNYTDIDYEMCSVLYNVGALHSILGSQETRFGLSNSFVNIIQYFYLLLSTECIAGITQG